MDEKYDYGPVFTGTVKHEKFMLLYETNVKRITCPVCGSVFTYYPKHAYVIRFGNKRQYYCRYNCFRTIQAKIEANKRSE